METPKRIRTALVSVYHKEGLEPVIRALAAINVKFFSTGGTYDFIRSLGFEATPVESLTTYPSILGGRVKTLHPVVFGGILARRENEGDREQLQQYHIPEIDLVVVDLYPFEETLARTGDEEEITEKIDIGGISLIRAAAKNFRDVLTVPSREDYPGLLGLLESGGGMTTLAERKRSAARAFMISSHYDMMIFDYFNRDLGLNVYKQSILRATELRYGENPHQGGHFFGNLDEVFMQLHGKEISYNNLVDIEAALSLIRDFHETAFAILKHTNACGAACRPVLADAWAAALAADPVSAYGGVLVSNTPVDESTAQEINKLFFEVLLAPGYEKNALELLQSRKNRILLQVRDFKFPGRQFKTVLNGVIGQDRDNKTETQEELRTMTRLSPGARETDDLLFANILVKHTKSNAIVLAKNRQLLASGTGQTSRVDALKQAIVKAKAFGFSLDGAVMASDAFFPFADCVEIAHAEGIRAVIQPGGSVRDEDSVKFCDEHGMSMVSTGFRHFKH